MKLNYIHMVIDAIFTLGEKKGSSREAIWKYVHTKYAEHAADKKVFLVQMRRIVKQGS